MGKKEKRKAKQAVRLERVGFMYEVYALVRVRLDLASGVTGQGGLGIVLMSSPGPTRTKPKKPRSRRPSPSRF